MKGKTISLLAYGLLVLCLAFTMGYLLGSGRQETAVTVTTVEAAPEAEQSPNLPAVSEDVVFPMNINTATQLQLEQLPGIGSGIAARIVAYRKEHGAFLTTEQLMDVEGIGEKRYAALEQLVTVGGTQ